MELKASEAFTWWGTFVAKHKLIVMIASIVIALVLSIGMVNMVITTDPVELWAGPNSRSRIEKDFFDSKFRPFYRTEMVIIKAKNLERVIKTKLNSHILLNPSIVKCDNYFLNFRYLS